MLPGVKVPLDYRERFRSSDGKLRAFVVEGAGGPSWYTEYNVLTGLSVRSYGRFSESVTRLAAGHVKRGLPQALRKCGYSTYSLYSWFGAFVGARRFQTSTGVEHFLDAKQLRTGPADTDIFFYDHGAVLSRSGEIRCRVRRDRDRIRLLQGDCGARAPFPRPHVRARPRRRRGSRHGVCRCRLRRAYCAAIGRGRARDRHRAGYEMGRPSLIRLSAAVNGGRLTSAAIGGDAVVVTEGTLEA